MSQVTIQIDDSRIASLLCAGFEGGSGYWLRIEEYQEPAEPRGHLEDLEDEVFPHVDYPLCEGGAVVCRDTIEGKRYLLDRAAIDRGLALLATQAPRHFAHWMGNTHDADTGDAFLQLCLLGSVVYG